jgi:hypothetical protein
MNRRLKIFLIISFLAFLASFVVQVVFQSLGAKSDWGVSPGWQREIAFWNVALAVIVFLSLRQNEERTGMIVAVGCTCLFALLGINHLWSFLMNPAAYFHWPPLFMNFIGLIFGVRVVLGSGSRS